MVQRISTGVFLERLDKLYNEKNRSMKITSALIKKYNVPAPRYTSYPTVPCWQTDYWSRKQWVDSVKRAYSESRPWGISIYIHLPFCESLCTYCGCTTRITKNHSVELPYIAAILKEWSMYCDALGSKPRIREIHLGGGTPTFFSPENLEKLIGGITSTSEQIGKPEFSFEGHPANTTAAHLQVLYNCGFRRLSLGIKDFDEKVQKIINRKQCIEQVRLVTEEARRIGYTSINYDLIYGLPLQTLSSVAGTIDEVLSLSPDRIAFYSYAHVPWLKPGQRSFSEKDLPSELEKQELHDLGCELLTDAGYLNIGMDHFSLPGDNLYKVFLEKQLHRNFMGYTHNYTQLSIGLGVSAISDSLYAFAQNPKDLESYLQQIKKGNIPSIKGHVLSQEDIVMRRYILNIMCNGEAHLNLNDPWSADIITRLMPLLTDGLVELNNSGTLHVTDTGKKFLKNICMCFDLRLHNKKTESQVFSMAV